MIIDKLIAQGIRITSVSDRLHVVHGNNRSRSPFSNSFLVLDKVNTLFDTGCGHDILEKVCTFCTIERVFLSHSHLDHTSGSWLIQKKCNSEILVPAECSDSIARAEKLASRFVGKSLAGPWLDIYPAITGYKDFEINAGFINMQEFSTGHMRFIALHTPGHLKDHYCFMEPDKKIILGFDIDLSPFGPWYGNLESDIALFKGSIKNIKAVNAEIYLSSHARPLKSPYIAKRLNSYSLFFDQRNNNILNLLSDKGPMDIDQMVRQSPFYEADHSLGDAMLRFGEEQMIRKHIEDLMEKDLIIKDGKFYRISDRK